MPKVQIGFKITKPAFLKEWPEGIEKSFDKEYYSVIEVKGFSNEYIILSRTVYDLSKKQIEDMTNTLETIACLPFQPVIRLADEVPDEWVLFME